jgi:hypothetical protein
MCFNFLLSGLHYQRKRPTVLKACGAYLALRTQHFSVAILKRIYQCFVDILAI